MKKYQKSSLMNTGERLLKNMGKQRPKRYATMGIAGGYCGKASLIERILGNTGGRVWDGGRRSL